MNRPPRSPFGYFLAKRGARSFSAKSAFDAPAALGLLAVPLPIVAIRPVCSVRASPCPCRRTRRRRRLLRDRTPAVLYSSIATFLHFVRNRFIIPVIVIITVSRLPHVLDNFDRRIIR